MLKDEKKDEIGSEFHCLTTNSQAHIHIIALNLLTPAVVQAASREICTGEREYDRR